MNSASFVPPVFHGGDDLNDALAHLSWKEMGIMTGIALIFLILVFLVALAVE